MDAVFARYAGPNGRQPVIAFAGRKKVHMITINPDLRVESKLRTEERWLTEFDHKQTMKAIAERFLIIGARAGSSERARSLLARLL